MKVLFMSGLYASPLQPKRSIGNKRIIHAMRAHAEVRAVAPLAYYPSFLVRRYPELYDMTQVPTHEIEDDGSTLYHPRLLHLPLFGRSLYAALYAASMAVPLAREVRRFRPDAMLSAWAYPDGTAAVALGRLLGLPTVVRVMGSDINEVARQALRREQIAWAMRRAHRVIAVSRAMAREVEALGVDRERVVVIPTGVDTRRFRPVPRAQARDLLRLDRGPVIVYPGRLSPEKGVRFLIEALPGLVDRHPGLLVILVGDGPEREALAAQAERLGVAAHLSFAGYQPEARMSIYLSAADLVCMPSLNEGWPDALMEAFACGCPVVATEVGGVPDIVALTGAGALVPAGDAAALGRALLEGLGRSWDRSAIAATMERYSLDETARRYLDVLRSAAFNGRP